MKIHKIIKTLEGAGFPLFIDNVIFLFKGGSSLYGTYREGESDTDWYGVFIEDRINSLGLCPFDQFVYSSAGKNKNSTYDIDITLFSLKKFIYFVSKGNPSVISFLFVPEDKVLYSNQNYWGGWIMKNIHQYVSKHTVECFMNTSFSLIKRVKNHCEKSGIVDYKELMHSYRIASEALDLAQNKNIIYPRVDNEFLLAIKNKEFQVHYIEDVVQSVDERVKVYLKESNLIDKIHQGNLSEIVSDMYVKFYRQEDEDQ